jgi:peptide/nickel transport system substrate-binding protein
MRKLLFICLALILISGLVFCSCAKTSPTPTATAAPAAATPSAVQPQSGGVLKIIVPPGLSNLGYPGKAYTSGGQMYIRAACEFLLNFDPKGTGNYVPELATGWQWSTDYRSLTLTLRQGVKFQDGTDFNADAVKYNLDLQRVGVRPELKSVTSIDVIDNYTIRLNLAAYNSDIMNALGSVSGWMVSPTALKNMGDAAMLHPVGTGPFKFVSYQTDTSLKFEKWDGYWQKGKPYLDGIEFVFIKDPVTQLMSFKTGEEQVLVNVLTKDVANLKTTSKYNFTPYPSASMGIAGDSAHTGSPFADIKVRRAIAYAIDNEAVAKMVGFGLYKGTNQFFDPSGPYYNQNIVGYPYNPAKAKQLLTEAGYPNGLDTKISFDSTNPDQVAMFNTVQSYLSAVGIKATLDAADPARFMQLCSGGWNNQLVYHWGMTARGIPPATQLVNFETGGRFDTKSILVPADFDIKYKQALAEPDQTKTTPIFQELSRMIIDDYCTSIPIMIPYSYLATNQNVRDFDMKVYGMAEWRPESAWLSK